MALENTLYRQHSRFFKLIFFNLLMLTGVIQGDDDCRTLEFKPLFDGQYLNNHVIKIHLSIPQNMCEFKCYMEPKCVSINFGPDASSGSQCELSDSDHKLHPDDLKQRDGFIYRPTENACASNPCSRNGLCQTGFTDKGYRCICSVGFTGEDCSIDIDLGKTSDKPGSSCKHILESGMSTGDGEYWIDPEKSGNPLKVHCDMTTDGGGWLLVARLVITNPEDPPYLTKYTPSHTYRGINIDYNNNCMGITKSAMYELRSHLHFTQLRFYCNKQQGRTFHVTTVANRTGEAVVKYFIGQRYVLPYSCNSFKRLNGDNSQLAKQCERWGNDNGHHVGKWGHYHKQGEYRMYNHAAFVANEYHWVIVNDLWLCDDVKNDHGTYLSLSPGDFWKIYVR